MPEHAAQEYVLVLQGMLAICSRYKSMFDTMQDLVVDVFSMWMDPDDIDGLSVVLQGNELVFRGKPSLEGTVASAAARLSSYSKIANVDMTPEYVLVRFLANLAKPLGKHLATQEITRIKQEYADNLHK